MNHNLSIIDVMKAPALFARLFRGETWAAWFVFSKALFAIAMTEGELAIFGRHTSRAQTLLQPARETSAAAQTVKGL